jgi:hypothetical protein
LFATDECDTNETHEVDHHPRTSRKHRALGPEGVSGRDRVTERGRLVANIVPAAPPPGKPFFANPTFTRAFLAQRKYLRGGTDSTLTISDERDHQIE